MKRKSCPLQAAYLAQDDPSIADAVRSLTGRMSSLSAADLSWSIRRPRMISCLRQCLNRSEYTWALIMLGVHSQGRSETGLATLPGRHCVRHARSVQSTTAFSSGESDGTACHEVVQQDLGCKSVALRLGYLSEFGGRVRQQCNERLD